MAEGYTTDEERVEALKTWWKNNGRSVILGVALGLGAVFGWRQWVEYRHGVAEQASAVYHRIEQLQAEGDVTQAIALADELVTGRPGSVYAWFATLSAARMEVEQGALEGAEARLRWALEHVPAEAAAGLARERLARVLATVRAEEALQLLEAPPAGYEALYAELRGDVLMDAGRLEDARDAYEAALAAMAPGDPLRATLRLKLEDLDVRRPAA